MTERTFLFTDIEGSTVLWERFPKAMQEALAGHDAILRRTIESFRGSVFKTIGDAFCAVFDDTADALFAAVSAQHELSQTSWAETGKLRVRMALHRGAAEERASDYFGPTLNRVARLMSAAHGGQILLSSAAANNLKPDRLPGGGRLLDLGEHRLKDLVRPEQVFQFADETLPSEFPLLRSLDASANNLPVQLTSFVGRENEVAEIRELLRSGRLVTLCGSGGSGKTRLALQVAAEVVDEYPNGAWFVELAPVTDASFVPHVVASALRLHEEPGVPLLQTLHGFLRDKRMLLVLDNCEHLITACAGLVLKLLQTCPHLKVLATSQEGLSIPGENAWRVPSLSLPPDSASANPNDVAQYGAVRLFVDRAIAADPRFEINAKNCGSVVKICRRLDGIPLAIELAAARIRILRPEEIALRLDDRFRLLTAGSRAALPRQQTLRAAIDWSYQLLGGSEGVLFRRLSVFSGGFTLETAEAICSDDILQSYEVFDSLCRLVDKSLVIAEEQSGSTRYRMLESIQNYADEKLKESDETAAIRRAHLSFFLGVSEQAEAEYGGAQQRTWYERIDREHDNIRCALAANAADASAATEVLKLASSMTRFWLVRGHWAEGLIHLAKALESPDTIDTDRAKALNGRGHMALQLGDYEAAESHYRQTVAIRRGLNDQRGVAVSLNNLGLVYLYQDENATALPLFAEALELFRGLGQRLAICAVLNNLGTIYSRQGEYDQASAMLEEAIKLAGELGDHLGVASHTAEFARLLWRRGNHAGAERLLEQSIETFRHMGEMPGIAEAMQSLGDVAVSMGDFEKARGHYEESLKISRTLFARRTVDQATAALSRLAALATAGA